MLQQRQERERRAAHVPPPSERGPDDKPLRVVAVGELAAVVSDHDQSRLSSSALSLWGYEQVMERLMASRTVLPARFGTVLADDAPDAVRGRTFARTLH